MYEVLSAYMKRKYGYSQLQLIRSLAWAVKAENPKWIEEARQKQFDDSLDTIYDKEDFDTKTLEKLVDCYIDIANADEFIHENEVALIQHAIKAWSLDLTIAKPKSGERLKVQK